MKKIQKVILIIFSGVGILFSICIFAWFLRVPLITDALFRNNNLIPKFSFIFAGYTVIIGLLFLVFILIAVFSPDRSNTLIIKKPKGELRFTKRTIESTARYSFSDLSMVSNAEVLAIFYERSERITIHVMLSLDDTNDLVAVTEKIQSRIQAALHASLGVDTQKIIIKVVETKQDYRNNTPIGIGGGKAEAKGLETKDDVINISLDEDKVFEMEVHDTETEIDKDISAAIESDGSGDGAL